MNTNLNNYFKLRGNNLFKSVSLINLLKFLNYKSSLFCCQKYQSEINIYNYSNTNG